MPDLAAEKGGPWTFEDLQALPEGLWCYGIVDGALVRSPAVQDVPKQQVADVEIAIEVVSPGSATTDRITKPAQYTAAGIVAFWRGETTDRAVPDRARHRRHRPLIVRRFRPDGHPRV